MTGRVVSWFSARAPARAALLILPGTLFLVAFFLAPLLVMVAYSAMPRGTYGGVEPGVSFASYARLLDPLYLRVLLDTCRLAAITTALCLLVGYPVAWCIASAGKHKHVLLFLFVLPFWTSFLVRTYAIIFLLRDTGLVNSTLLALGLIDEPLELLYTPGAVLLGLVHGFLPFMVLPIYASLEHLDRSLLEAAEVLGARRAARFFSVVLPLSLPGVVAGCALVFIPALGSFLTPDLLGGAKQVMAGNLVQNQFTIARDWPFGSAIALVLLTCVLVALALQRRLLAGRGVATT